MIDAAPSGSEVRVPPGIYREAVSVEKPLTLVGQRGVEVRGSDVWADWQQHGDLWVSVRTVPPLLQHGQCAPSSDGRCRWPEQVFVDGVPLMQVAGTPARDQFALDQERRVVLAVSPIGRTVEVSTRDFWVSAGANDVTIEGFTMRHAANAAQTGAIRNTLGTSRTTVKDNVLSDAHGATVSLSGGSGHEIVGNDIQRAGHIGIHSGWGPHNPDRHITSNLVIRHNRIHSNSTEGFDTHWEAGGLKLTFQVGSMVQGNDVFANHGPGIWCDLDCRDITINGNRVYQNSAMGIFFEISDGADVTANVVWENGSGFPKWGWGAGIIAAGSSNVLIQGNVVTANADGIVVVSQDRGQSRWNTVRNVVVRENVIVMPHDPRDAEANYALAWLQDWRGMLLDPASDNRGERNQYWAPPQQTSPTLFAWGKDIRTLDEFNATPGDTDGRHLTEPEKDQLLALAGVPRASLSSAR